MTFMTKQDNSDLFYIERTGATRGVNKLKR